jgi:hypothetical protein
MDRLMRAMMPLQTDAELESALHDAAEALANKKGSTLVRTVNGYRLAGHGRTIHVGQVEDAATAVRKLAKSLPVPFAGAASATDHDSAENSLDAVLRVWPIETIDWTFIAEIATRARDTEDAGLSNEK